MVGAGQILFGSDYPYLQRDRFAIERDNALSAFSSAADGVGVAEQHAAQLVGNVSRTIALVRVE